MTTNYRELASIYKALGDETRLRILKMLAQNKRCVCEMIEPLGMSQPTVSHHLKILRQADLVIDVKKGKWTHYSINWERFEDLSQWLKPDVQDKGVSILSLIDSQDT